MKPLLVLAGVLAAWCSAPAVESGMDPSAYGAIFNEYSCALQLRDDGFTEETRWEIEVHNQRGDQYADVYLYASPFVTLSDVRVEVYNKDGRRVSKHGLSDFGKAKGWDAVAIFSDSRSYFLPVTGAGYPYRVVCSYKSNYASLFFLDGATVQQQLPVKRFSYAIKSDTAIGYRYQCEWPDAIETVETDGDKRTRRWEAQEIPARARSREMARLQYPARIKVAPRHFSLQDTELHDLTWKEAGLWYNQLADGRYELPDSALVTAGDDDLSRLAAIYEDVVSKIRYIAVSVGLSGWQPAAAEETQRCGYGDCKGMSTLIVAQARYAGVEAYPVLVLTKDFGQIDPQFPELGFNHCVVMAVADDDTLWLDPTCEDCQFGDAPFWIEGVNGLVITDTGGVLVPIPVSAAEENRVEISTEVQVVDAQRTHLRSRLDFSGNPASMLRMMKRYLDHDGIKNIASRLVPGGPGKYELVSYSFVDSACGRSRMCLTVDAVSTTRVRNVGGATYVEVPLIEADVVSFLASQGMVQSSSLPAATFAITDVVRLAADSSVGSVQLIESDHAVCGDSTVRLEKQLKTDSSLNDIRIVRSFSDYVCPETSRPPDSLSSQLCSRLLRGHIEYHFRID